MLLSAYLRRRPVVASRVGGLPELVEPDASGGLVPPRDPAALAGTVARLLAEPDRLRDMGLAARRLLDRRYAWPGIARLTMDLYRRL